MYSSIYALYIIPNNMHNISLRRLRSDMFLQLIIYNDYKLQVVLIQRSRISLLNTDAFSGLSTVETVELFNNEIGTIGARAFASIVNLGRIRIARNHIQTLQTVESLLSMAIQTRIEENTIDCGCDLQWMTAHQDKILPDVNYCGVEGVHRTIRSFLRQKCARTTPTSTSSSPFPVTNHERHINTAENSAQYNLFYCHSTIAIIISVIQLQ
ncbi:hypothetical protein DICVIV_13217 [Dictyocaulus viviparus]|uniref:Leucine Rich repeat-containing domain protein n=1 Tax=Dictyocaulus viviparus TaxID=29172 RepID=A0A0D8XAN8_DICVI|nr:hypothetical protein DICVIV_13217 [Dictyocaulus viviparus]